MPITDISSGLVVLGDIVAQPAGVYASASAAYDAWAAANGLSNTATISSFDSDDGVVLLDLGFAPLLGSSETRIAVSGESGLHFFKAPITNGSATNYTISAGGVVISRMQGVTAPPPTFLLAIRPDTQDAGVGSSKWQKATNVAILYYKTGHYSSRVYTDVAVLITPASLELVVTVNTAEGQRFSQSQFDQSDGNYFADSAKYIDGALSGTKAFIAHPPSDISGVVNDSLGAPAARTVRAYSRATGQLEATTVSNTTTGAYTLQVFGPGERNVVCLDDASGDLNNDLILRVTPT